MTQAYDQNKPGALALIQDNLFQLESREVIKNLLKGCRKAGIDTAPLNKTTKELYSNLMSIKELLESELLTGQACELPVATDNATAQAQAFNSDYFEEYDVLCSYVTSDEEFVVTFPGDMVPFRCKRIQQAIDYTKDNLLAIIEQRAKEANAEVGDTEDWLDTDDETADALVAEALFNYLLSKTSSTVHNKNGIIALTLPGHLPFNFYNQEDAIHFLTNAYENGFVECVISDEGSHKIVFPKHLTKTCEQVILDGEQKENNVDPLSSFDSSSVAHHQQYGPATYINPESYPKDFADDMDKELIDDYLNSELDSNGVLVPKTPAPNGHTSLDWTPEGIEEF